MDNPKIFKGDGGPKFGTVDVSHAHFSLENVPLSLDQQNFFKI
jgi:hypothetical protein